MKPGDLVVGDADGVVCIAARRIDEVRRLSARRKAPSRREAFRQLRCLTSPEHVHRTRIEDAWIAGQQRAARRLEGMLS